MESLTTTRPRRLAAHFLCGMRAQTLPEIDEFSQNRVEAKEIFFASLLIDDKQSTMFFLHNGTHDDDKSSSFSRHINLQCGKHDLRVNKDAHGYRHGEMDKVQQVLRLLLFVFFFLSMEINNGVV